MKDLVVQCPTVFNFIISHYELSGRKEKYTKRA